MATREHQITFRINGALSSQFSGAMREALNQMQSLARQAQLQGVPMTRAMRSLQAYQGKLAQTLANVNEFKELNQSISQNSAALVQARLRAAQLNTEYQKQRQQTDRMKESYERLKQVYRDNKSSMDSSQKQVWQNQLQAAREELKAQRKRESDSLTDSTVKNKTVEGLARKLEEQQSKLAQLRTSLSQAGVSAGNLAADEARLRAEIEQTTQALERQTRINLEQHQTRQRHSEAQNNLSNAFGNFQGAISTASSIMSPFADSVNTAMAFQKTMSKLKSISQMDLIRAGNVEQANANMRVLEATAKRLGATTVYTAQQIGEAQIYLAQMGATTEQIDKSTEPLLKLAAAGDMDFSRAADIATNVMAAFGHDLSNTEQMNKDLNALAYVTTHSNQNLSQLGETMKYVAPVAKSFGLELGETAAVTKFMADAGIQGSQAGTSFRQLLLRLTAPPKKASKAMQEYGITLDDANAAWQNAQATAQAYGITLDNNVAPGKQFLNIVKQVNANMKGSSSREKLGAISAIAGINASSGALMALDQNPEMFEKWLDDVENSAGTLDAMYSTMTDNAWGANESFNSAFEAASLSIGETFLPIVESGYNKAAEFLQQIVTFTDSHRDLVQAAGLAAAAVSAVLVAVAGYGLAAAGVEYLSASFALLRMNVGNALASVRNFLATTTLSSALSSVTASITNLGTAFASAGRAALGFVFSPIGAALMALGLAGYYVYTHWSQVAPVFSQLASTLSGSLSGAIASISTSFETLGTSISRLGPAFEQIGGAIFAALAVGLNAVVNIGATLISTFANAIAAVISLFGGLGNAIASALAGDWDKAAEHFKNAFVNAADFVLNAIKSLFGGIVGTFANFFKPLEIFSASDKNSSGGGNFQNSKPSEQSQINSEQLVSAISNAIATAQKENPQNDFTKIEAAITAAAQKVKDDPKSDPAQIAQAIAAAVKESKAENPEQDFSKLESVLTNAVSQIQQQQQAQSEQKNLETESLQASITQTAETLSQVPQSFATLSDGVTQVGTGVQTFNAGLTESQVANSANTVAVNENSNALNASGTALNGFNSALQSTNGGLQSLSGSASSASSAVSGLAGAASSAVSALQSAASSAVSAASSIAAAKPAANYSGGIYSKGAFLTTFAEKSPEAAIPIDNSKRAVDLWTKTGQMLGQLPGNTTFAPDQAQKAQQLSTLERAQRRRLEQVKAQYEAAKKTPAVDSSETETKSPTQRRLEQVQKYYERAKAQGTLNANKNTLIQKLPNIETSKISQTTKYDNLGNVIGYKGLPDNIITADDSIAVARAKKNAQLSEMAKINSVQKSVPENPKSTEALKILPKTPKPHKMPTSIFSGSMDLPMSQTLPRNLPAQIGSIGDFLPKSDFALNESVNSLIDNLLSKVFASKTVSDMQPIDLHFEINIAGNANSYDVEQGIRQSIPMIEESFSRQFAEFNHERQRVGF